MARLVKQLSSLSVDEISLVDRGANQHAEIAIAKRDSGAPTADMIFDEVRKDWLKFDEDRKRTMGSERQANRAFRHAEPFGSRVKILRQGVKSPQGKEGTKQMWTGFGVGTAGDVAAGAAATRGLTHGMSRGTTGTIVGGLALGAGGLVHEMGGANKRRQAMLQSRDKYMEVHHHYHYGQKAR